MICQKMGGISDMLCQKLGGKNDKSLIINEGAAEAFGAVVEDDGLAGGDGALRGIEGDEKLIAALLDEAGSVGGAVADFGCAAIGEGRGRDPGGIGSA